MHISGPQNVYPCSLVCGECGFINLLDLCPPSQVNDSFLRRKHPTDGFCYLQYQDDDDDDDDNNDTNSLTWADVTELKALICAQKNLHLQ
jgi:hypothetical protein